MIDVVICEDNTVLLTQIEELVKNYGIKKKINIRTHKFTDINNNLIELIKLPRPKIYILDVELSSTSGLDVATRVRRSGDWNSVIIINSGHSEYIEDAFKRRVQVLDYILKYGDFLGRLYKTLHNAFHSLNFNVKSREEQQFEEMFEPDKINYIEKITHSNRCIVNFTNNTQIEVEKNLNTFLEKLEGDFEHTHKSCIVNLRNASFINFREGYITFYSNSTLTLLSKNYKRDIKRKLAYMEGIYPDFIG